MKKLLLSVMAALAMVVSFTSCKCTGGKTAGETTTVEQVIANDREHVSLNYGGEYRWFETNVVLKNWLDEEVDDSVDEIVNIFQVQTVISPTVTDVFVYYYRHAADSLTIDEYHGFIVGDRPLNDDEILVPFKQAYEKVQASNYVKPHSRQVVLRKEPGTVEANAQWIFGNQDAQLYVDTKTGAVRDTNPAYEDE